MAALLKEMVNFAYHAGVDTLYPNKANSFTYMFPAHTCSHTEMSSGKSECAVVVECRYNNV